MGLAVLFLALAVSPVEAEDTPRVASLVPRPVKMVMRDGRFLLDQATIIVAAPQLKGKAEQLKKMLGAATGLPLAIKDAAEENAIQLRLDPSLNAKLGDEGYILSSAPAKISISASGEAGIFYGMQTLRQLLPPQVYSNKRARRESWPIPCLVVRDFPRFSWRGLHLDVARHFFSLEFVKRYIDLMSLHKFNVLHWHLNDDQGWRWQVKKYPRLTSVGAWRSGDTPGEWFYFGYEYPGSKAYGGFYTQAQLKEIVAYAQQRHVNILPEIEMPGHSECSLVAYPEYACPVEPPADAEGGERAPGARGWIKNVYCAGNDATFAFINDILDEAIAVFPFEYVHVGGDEVAKGLWERCPSCQARIKAEGLKDENELQGYFMRRVDEHLRARGRKLIGWDEIVEGGLPPGATVTSWRGTSNGIEAAKMGYDVVMAPSSHLYFDAVQGPSENEPKAIGYRPLTLERVYSFEPVPKELRGKAAKRVLGAQGQAWSEWFWTGEHVLYMVYPRACALAEVVWSPKKGKDYDDFLDRIIVHEERLVEMKANSRPVKKSDYLYAEISRDAKGKVSISCRPRKARVHYTLDGSEPTLASPRYRKPFKLAREGTVKAVGFAAPGDEKGPVSEAVFGYPKGKWRVVSVDAAHEWAPGEEAIDDEKRTAWFTPWDEDPPPAHPHEIVVDLGEVLVLKGISYLPYRRERGRIKGYEVYVKRGGTDWCEAVARGEFAWREKERGQKEVLFDKAVAARMIRFVALSAKDGGPFTGVAELGVIR